MKFNQRKPTKQKPIQPTQDKFNLQIEGWKKEDESQPQLSQRQTISNTGKEKSDE